METTNLEDNQVITMVLTCTDLFHPILQQPHYSVFRVACNCVIPHNTAALEHIVQAIQKNEIKRLLVVGHLPCSALIHNIMQTLTQQRADDLPYRIGSLLNSIVGEEPALTADEAIRKVARENIKQEIESLKNYFGVIMPEAGIEISGALINEDEEFTLVESESLIL